MRHSREEGIKGTIGNEGPFHFVRSVPAGHMGHPVQREVQLQQRGRGLRSRKWSLRDVSGRITWTDVRLRSYILRHARLAVFQPTVYTINEIWVKRTTSAPRAPVYSFAREPGTFHLDTFQFLYVQGSPSGFDLNFRQSNFL